jgi:hypothetical protein
MAGTKHFYDTMRPVLFSTGLSTKQFDGIESILKLCADSGITDTRWIAYILGTIYHECNKTMQPIEEYGKGQGHPYGKKLKMATDAGGNHIPYTTPDQIYYGRGYVQLTWYENYAAQGKILGLDLLNNPEWVLQSEIAGKILIHGMTKGDFTGRYLSQFFNDTTSDYINARKIINGLDRAAVIANYAHTFFAGLTEPA